VAQLIRGTTTENLQLYALFTIAVLSDRSYPTNKGFATVTMGIPVDVGVELVIAGHSDETSPSCAQ